MHHVTVGALPALRLAGLASSLAASLATTFARSKRLLVARVPTGGQCTLAELLVVGVRATVSLRTVPVVTEVKADLLLCITAHTLTLGGGQGLVRSGLSSGLGCGLDFRLEPCKLLLGVSELARGGVRAGARGRVNGVGDSLVGRLPLLELQDHFVGFLPRPGRPQHRRLVGRPQPLVCPDLLLKMRGHLPEIGQVEFSGRLA